MAVALIGALGFSSSCDTEDTRATQSPSTTTSISARAGSENVFPNGLRNVRYCEVLLVTKPTDSFVAEVWNTLGYSTCPQSQWASLKAQDLQKETGALVAVLNGPRFWTLDQIDSDIRRTAPTRSFGGMKMFRAATLDLGTQPPNQDPYVERGVARETVFSFHKGSEVYELTDPNGSVYVMQSYSLIKDPTMVIARLKTLGNELHLPAGWKYSVATLTADRNLTSTNGIATVIQDEFQNTYQRDDTRVAG